MKKLVNALKNYYLSKKLKIVRIAVYGVLAVLFVVFIVMAITPASFCSKNSSFSDTSYTFVTALKSKTKRMQGNEYFGQDSIYVSGYGNMNYEWTYDVEKKDLSFDMSSINPQLHISIFCHAGRVPFALLFYNNLSLTIDIINGSGLDGGYKIVISTGDYKLDRSLVETASLTLKLFYTNNRIGGSFNDILAEYVNYTNKVNGVKTVGIAITCVAGVLLAVNTFLTVYIKKKEKKQQQVAENEQTLI